MGGIESVMALPGDKPFKQKDNNYNTVAYKKNCGEFHVDPSSDFRFTHGQNHGLGYVNILYFDGDFAQKKWMYSPADLSNPSSQRFADEGGKDDAGNKIDFIRNDQGAAFQFEYFVPNVASGLTNAGLARINQSIEAYVYCILSSRAITLSSILGSGGRSVETQRNFLKNMESAVITTDIGRSVQRYQKALSDTKTRLNFAVSRGTWLMPSRMIINTKSIVGYNNYLQTADEIMKLGVNNDVNQETKNASLKPMTGGPCKINPPNSHPSNPIHKQATEAQGLVKKKNPPATHTDLEAPATQAPATDTLPVTTTDPVDTHHVNKALGAVGALVLVGLVVWART